MITPTNTDDVCKEAFIFAVALGVMSAVILTFMLLISDFVGFYQTREHISCPPGGVCQYIGWAGIAGIVLTGYGVGLGYAFYRFYIWAHYRENPHLLLPAYQRDEVDA